MKALSTADIVQFLRRHPTFRGCFPLDRIPPLTHTPCSMVVNTDKSGGKGEHWVAVYMGDDCCCYFDSLGLPLLEEELHQFLGRYYKTATYNKTPIQHWSSVLCGYFCVLFVKCVDSVESFDSFVQQFNKSELKQNDVLVRSLFTNKH